MKLLAIFLACLLAHQINGFSDRMCGAKLTEIMWTICENGFNDMMVKRSEGFRLAKPAVEKIDDSSSSLSNIFQVEAGNLLAKTRRIRMMGIADECCKKSCSFSELTAYCN